MRWRRTKTLIVIALSVCIFTLSLGHASATNSAYGAGAYGECQYGYEGSTCSISISNTNGNPYYLNLSLTPAQTNNCSVGSDTVNVTTYDPSGYTLTLADQSTSTGLINGSYTIPADSGTLARPQSLSDTWGYREDSATIGGFGTGPTTTGNQISTSLLFAGLQPSNATPDTIASTSSYNSSAVSTTIFYGLCMDYNIAVPTGQYSSVVVYTATAN